MYKRQHTHTHTHTHTHSQFLHYFCRCFHQALCIDNREIIKHLTDQLIGWMCVCVCDVLLPVLITVQYIFEYNSSFFLWLYNPLRDLASSTIIHHSLLFSATIFHPLISMVRRDLRTHNPLLNTLHSLLYRFSSGPRGFPFCDSSRISRLLHFINMS